MELKEALQMLDKSKEFTSWQKKHPKSYLGHAFTVFESEHVQDDWQIGFYNPETDKITVFVLEDNGKKVTKNPETEALKEQGKLIEQVDIKKVKVDVSSAMKTANDLQEEKYSSHPVYKTIVILQNLQDFGIVWNITMVTRTFKTLNIKIAADDGSIKKEDLVSILERVSGAQD